MLVVYRVYRIYNKILVHDWFSYVGNSFKCHGYFKDICNFLAYYHFRATVNGKLFVTRLKHSSLSSQTVAFWSANPSNLDSSASNCLK